MWVKFRKSIKKKFPFLIPVVWFVRSSLQKLSWLIHLYITGSIRTFLHLPEKEPHKLIRFELHVSEHCNLNCAGCDHFSPLAEPAFIDINDFKKDFARMGELFSHKCEWIHLLGGEPLLNPDIIELMKIARENFIEGDIDIITNGILLPGMDEKFWRACHDNNIKIRMTHYPIKIDIDKIKASAEKFDVSFQYFGQETEKNLFAKEPLDLSGKRSAARSFMKCTRANSCIFLRSGKLFTCTMLPNLHFFNKAFSQNIPITEADYIDIYSDITPEEILRKLATHVPACRYCDIDGIDRNIKWHVSKREMSEWV